MPEVNSDQQLGSQPPMGGQSAPSGTPSGAAVPPAGEIELAKANVSIAISMLEKQLPLLGTDTEEGQDLLKALTLLSKKFSGKKSDDLAPAELMQVMGAQPDAYKAAMMKEMGGQPGGQPGAPGAPQQSPVQFS